MIHCFFKQVKKKKIKNYNRYKKIKKVYKIGGTDRVYIKCQCR